MQTTKIKAQFVGEQGSLGFKKNQEYELDFKSRCDGQVEIMHDRPGNLIPYQYCIYKNLRLFLTNWTNVHI